MARKEIYCITQHKEGKKWVTDYKREDPESVYFFLVEVFDSRYNKGKWVTRINRTYNPHDGTHTYTVYTCGGSYRRIVKVDL